MLQGALTKTATVRTSCRMAIRNSSHIYKVQVPCLQNGQYIRAPLVKGSQGPLVWLQAEWWLSPLAMTGPHPHHAGRETTKGWGWKLQAGCLLAWHFLLAPLWPGTKNSFPYFFSQPSSPLKILALYGQWSSAFFWLLLASKALDYLGRGLSRIQAGPVAWREVTDPASQLSDLQGSCGDRGGQDPGTRDGCRGKRMRSRGVGWRIWVTRKRTAGERNKKGTKCFLPNIEQLQPE